MIKNLTSSTLDRAKTDIAKLDTLISLESDFMSELESKERELYNSVVESTRYMNELTEYVQLRLKEFEELYADGEGESINEKDAGILFDGLQALDLMDAEINFIEDQFEMAAPNLEHPSAGASGAGLFQKAKAAISGWAKRLKSAIKRVSQKLWAIISSFLKPEGWKLSGELSSGVLGFAKSSVEISFGQ